MTSAAVAEKLAPAGLYQQMRREVNNASRSAEAKDLGGRRDGKWLWFLLGG